MNREIQLENGEKLFVSGFITAAAAESLVTLVANGTHFNWYSTLNGALGTILMLLLADRLYRGDRYIAPITLFVILMQLGLGLRALVDAVGLVKIPETFEFMALPFAWLAVVKILAYAILLSFLLCSTSVQDFLAWRRGEQVPERSYSTNTVEEVTAQAPSIPPSGVTISLSEKETASYANLPWLLQTAGAVLAVLGLLRVVYGILALKLIGLPGLFMLLDGTITLVLGLLLGLPAAACNLLKSEGPDLAYVMNAVRSLKSYYSLQFLLSIVLAGVLVLGQFIWPR